jgi:ferredoxin-thioredoxin reductase catalytic subunit
MKNEDIIRVLYEKLKREAESSGYYLNPDVEFTKELVKGLIINDKRYGYWACPCRLASGKKSEDIDIICPCDYRDPDLNEFGMCYCCLYVSQDVSEGKKEIKSIPERRDTKINRPKDSVISSRYFKKLSKTVWRCKVCGYLCARDEPPEVCPVCKAKKDRFEKFIF